VEGLDKIAEDLEDVARRHNSKELYWHVNKLRGSSQPRLFPVKHLITGPHLVIRKKLKRDGKNILSML